jgi:hypothetical protein
VLDSGVARAIDLDTGRVVWERRYAVPDEPHAHRTLVLAPRAVVVGLPRSLDVIDPASGALLRRIPVSGLFDAFMRSVADGDELFGTVLRPVAAAPDVRARVLTSFDLAEGRVRWEASPVLVAVDAQGDALYQDPVAVDVDSVYACFKDGGLRAFDRATGALRYHLGLGHCQLAFLDRDRSGARSIVVEQLVGKAAGSTVLLARGPSPTAAERVHVVGRVRAPRGGPWANRPVLVDGTLTRTDALGRFDATVTARDVVDVTVPDRRLFGMKRVLPDGRSTPYALEVQMTEPGPVD